SNYSVDLVANPDPPRPEGTTFLLSVRRDGRAITGAKVCLTADMPDMQHPGINTVAKEGSGGRYEARLQFGMGGSWRTSVTIAEPDKPAVSVPLTIQVAEVSPN
ncbi:MAG: FixH family protein, partial [Actinomycetota bacterium]|nr:FixH family protein [Actinomycetota bacterium]